MRRFLSRFFGKKAETKRPKKPEKQFESKIKAKQEAIEELKKQFSPEKMIPENSRFKNLRKIVKEILDSTNNPFANPFLTLVSDVIRMEKGTITKEDRKKYGDTNYFIEKKDYLINGYGFTIEQLRWLHEKIKTAK